MTVQKYQLRGGLLGRRETQALSDSLAWRAAAVQV
jgi:hypothetical protein